MANLKPSPEEAAMSYTKKPTKKDKAELAQVLGVDEEKTGISKLTDYSKIGTRLAAGFDAVDHDKE